MKDKAKTKADAARPEKAATTATTETAAAKTPVQPAPVPGKKRKAPESTTGGTDNPVQAAGAPVQDPAADPQKAPSSGAEAENTGNKTDITFSQSLKGFFAANNVSLAFTSYQSGNFYIFGHGPDNRLSMHQAAYPQTMGITGDANRIYLASHAQIIRLENVLGQNQLANKKHDCVYVPRNFQTTGAVDLHEIGICADGKVVFVNTKYSCLCEFSLTHSFRPIWKPAFISKLAPEDRCHLNGLAMRNGKPRYVTAVCKSDVIDGWRDRRHDGGIVIDIETDEIIAEGLSMPHSPRWYNGKVWVVNSGTGEIGWIDENKKKFIPFTFAPGFIRGLAFFNGYMAVTLSKPRYKRFDGLALAGKLEEKDADPWCGVQIISLQDGSVAQWIRFDGAIQELFDVCFLAGVKNALTLGPRTPEFQTFITIEQPAYIGKTAKSLPETTEGDR